MIFSPVEIVELAAKIDVVVEIALPHFFQNMLAEVDGGNPALLDLGEPLFIIAIVGAVEIEDVFADEHKLIDAIADEDVDDLGFERHHIVADGVVPFADELEDGAVAVIIDVEQFGEEGVGAKIFPLGMDQVVVDAVFVVELRVFLSVKRRQFVFFGIIIV